MKNRVQKGSSEEILVKKTKKLSKKFNQMIKKAKKKGLEIKSQKPNEVNRKNKKYLKTARQTSNKIERKK
jgi:hypothetical protein